MRLMVGYIRRHLITFIAAMAFLTLEAVADLLQPAFMARVVDEGVKGADMGRIMGYGAIMLGIAALGALGAVMRNLYASRTSQLIGMELRSDIYKKVQALSFENIDRLQPASIITRITNDVTQIQNFVNSCMRIMIKAPITCLGAIALIIMQTPRQTPVMLVILALSALLIFGNMKLGYPRFGVMQRKLDKLNDVSRAFLSSIRVVKAFGAEDQEERKFSDAATQLAGAGTDAMRVMAVFAPLINLTVNLGIVLLLWLSGGAGTGIGHIMASVNYMTQVLFALGMVSNILNTAVRAVASAQRVGEVLDEAPTQALPAHPLTPEIRGRVEFRHVSFTYRGAARPALSDVSLAVPPGGSIGIIGPTGSGKTSLVNLLPRFYDATGGQVLLDGADVVGIDQRLLRRSVAVVPQKALLFTGTVMDNLRWGDAEASDDWIMEAARIACAHDFVCAMPQGYATMLGQGGVNLSGGQKQRLALARALVRRPRVLILDDCTSALDADTEHRVLTGLSENLHGVTVLLISQRVSTVMRQDLIACMEDGQLMGLGTHGQLLKDCPVYRGIYDSQIGGEQDD